MPDTICIVEDDVRLRGSITRILDAEGFRVRGFSSAAELLEQPQMADADAFVIDIGLPDADGRDLCQALRAQGIVTPVLFLTARDALADRLGGFSAGGDDYLTKPFDIAELLARLNALLRRGGRTRIEHVSGMELDPAAHSIRAGEAVVQLTPTEFRLLATLAAHAGDVVTRRTLVAAGWPHGAIVHDNTLDVYVARIRRKLSSLTDAPELATIHGLGYRLS